MELALNGFSLAEFQNILGWRSSAYLHGRRSLSTSKHPVVFILFHCAFQIILSMCMIALIYLFSFHRTRFSSSNLVPVNVSSKYSFLSFFFFFWRVLPQGLKFWCLHVEWHGKTGRVRLIPHCSGGGPCVSELSHNSEGKSHPPPVRPGPGLPMPAPRTGSFPVPGGRKWTEIN